MRRCMGRPERNGRFAHRRDMSVIPEGHVTTESCRDQQQPQLRVDIEPWFLYHMDQPCKDFPQKRFAKIFIPCGSPVLQRRDYWEMSLLRSFPTRKTDFGEKLNLIGVWFDDVEIAMRKK